MNTYTYNFCSKCPSSGHLIDYKLQIATTDTIFVEHIKMACAVHKEGYQEAIAFDLHKRLGGNLILEAIHDGVHIKSEINKY